MISPLHPTPPSSNVPVPEAIPVPFVSTMAVLPLDHNPEPELMDIESQPTIVISDPTSPVHVNGTADVSVKPTAPDASVYKLQPLDQIFQTLELPPQPRMVRSRTATSPALVAAVSHVPPRRMAPKSKELLPTRIPTRPVQMKAPVSRRDRWKLMMSLCKAAQQSKDPEIPAVPIEIPSEASPKDVPLEDVLRKSSKGTKRSKVPKTKEIKEKKKKRADRVKK